jgi:AhpD family alkylhydroperoxidase
MPRLKSLDKSQASPGLQSVLADLESKKMLLNLYRGMANSPAVLDGYLKFNGALREGKLDAKIRAAIALTVAHFNQCGYCLAAQTALGRDAGLDDAAIRGARIGTCSDPKTAAAVNLARAVLRSHGRVSDAETAAARDGGLNDGDIAEVVANVVLSLFTNYFNNLNQTELDFPPVPLKIS